MSTNQEELKTLYKKITSGEILERLRSCGANWTQVGPVQYRATVTQDGRVWDIYVTRRPGDDMVVVDFSRDGAHMYSLNSDEEESLAGLITAIEGDVEFERDMELVRAVGNLPSCS